MNRIQFSKHLFDASHASILHATCYNMTCITYAIFHLNFNLSYPHYLLCHIRTKKIMININVGSIKQFYIVGKAKFQRHVHRPPKL